MGTLRDPYALAGFIFVIGLAMLAILPFYWTLVISLRIDDAIMSWPPRLLPPLEALGLDAWRAILSEPRVMSWLMNSAMITLASVALALLISIPAGYALSRGRGPEASVAAAAILASKLVPATVLVMPIYVLARMAGLLNNPAAVVLGNLSFAVPLATFLMKNAFDALPKELEEAAQMDGLGRMGALVRILVPNVAPAVAATAVYVFIVAWNDFLFARTLLTGGASTTITVGAASYLGEVTVHWNRLMALAALATAPCLMFFLALSGQLTRSIGSDVH
ncbi:MAG: carbohydrate ABC transporter permease [Beijerinckiaceae bacterium]